MINEQQFRQIGEIGEIDPMAALLGINVSLRRDVHQERARVNEVVVSQHTEDIESLKKQIDEKNKEITELQKSRNQEIKALKARLGRLDSEKKDLKDELRSVKVTVNRMEKDIKELALRQN